MDSVPGAIDEAGWERALAELLGHPVRVEYGRSRTSPVQLRAARRTELRARPELARGWVVRLHAMFADAPADVREALAGWIRSGRRARRASRRLGEWIEGALAELPAAAPRRARLEPRGAHHDLGPLAAGICAAELARDFGPGRPAPAVTWGRRGRSSTRGVLRLGSYEPSSDVARLHRVLDQPAVPLWFVRSVLFHELLHAAVPLERDAAGRPRHHGPRFRARERRYRDYRRALEWQAAHIDALVRSARSGRPMRAGRGAAPCAEPRQLELFG